MLRDGEAGAGGVAICVEDWRREAARVCGEGGTEFKSGMPVMRFLFGMESWSFSELCEKVKVTRS